MPEQEVEVIESDKSASSEAGQGEKIPETKAASPEASPKISEKSPEAGDTASAESKEAMVPSSRLREETEKRQKLESEVEELREMRTELEGIGSRFGKDSKAYLQELRKFYDQQDKVKRLAEKGIQPGSVEAELQELKDWKAQQEEERSLQPHIQQLRRELDEVKANPKYAVFAKNWGKWEKRILEGMRADPSLNAVQIAQDYLDLLDSEKTAYVKSKTEEGKRVIEGGGSGGSMEKSADGPTKLKNWGTVIEKAVKAARSQGEG